MMATCARPSGTVADLRARTPWPPPAPRLYVRAHPPLAQSSSACVSGAVLAFASADLPLLSYCRAASGTPPTPKPEASRQATSPLLPHASSNTHSEHTGASLDESGPGGRGSPPSPPALQLGGPGAGAAAAVRGPSPPQPSPFELRQDWQPWQNGGTSVSVQMRNVGPAGGGPLLGPRAAPFKADARSRLQPDAPALEMLSRALAAEADAEGADLMLADLQSVRGSEGERAWGGGSPTLAAWVETP